MNQLGIVTGLVSETDCLRAIGRVGLLAIRCAGADARRAQALARGLAEAGCVALASFGLAGGLDSALHSGDVILADRVVGDDAIFQAEGAWHARAHALLRGEAGLTVGLLAGADVTVGTPEEKQRLHEKTGAIAVDMESPAVASTARQFNLPFLAVRVIADTADRRVPAWLSGVIDEAGAVKPGAFCAGLLKRPGDLADIARLAGANRRALTSLRSVAALLGPGLGFL
ncbi:MAG: squalene--hopene cyclase [Rhodospirillales bacterium]|nr:squalene--hopene cyclase [Rhodospirillales bacterium]